MNRLFFFAALASAAPLVSSCDKDDDNNNDTEIVSNDGDYEFNDKSVNGMSFYATNE